MNECKYRIYAEDDNENQISKSYVVRNPNSFLTKLLVLYIKICCLDYYGCGGAVYVEPVWSDEQEGNE